MTLIALNSINFGCIWNET